MLEILKSLVSAKVVHIVLGFEVAFKRPKSSDTVFGECKSGMYW